MGTPFLDRVWAEIDLNAIDFNFNSIRTILAPTTKICCVIKANGYGHGGVKLAHEYQRLGADYLAVATAEEGLSLRKAKVDLPILVLGYVPLCYARRLAKNNITLTIYSYEYGIALSRHAKKFGYKIKAHLKLDTGMGRIGFRCLNSRYDELNKAYKICTLPNVFCEGIYTHFASADECGDYTKRQYENFCFGIKFLSDRGINFNVKHCSNSSAILRYPDFQMDMVRAGIILYGLSPSPSFGSGVFKPTMTLKSQIINVKQVYSGESVGYGRQFIAKSKTKVATLSVGYADGLARNNYKIPLTVVINGKTAPIIGKVCMDQLMVDVTNVNCKTGDSVTIFGGDSVQVKDIASSFDTIDYEVVCALSDRVKRVFVRN